MQYLLSEDEMATIRQRTIDAAKLPSLEALTNVVKHVATKMIAFPQSGEGAASPHGCIHVEDPRGPQYRVRYCDRCPVAGICPLPKGWSK